MLNEDARRAVAQRLAALDKADADYEAHRRRMAIETAEQAERLEANRHPFKPTGFAGYRCEDCSRNRAEAIHRDAEGNYLTTNPLEQGARP